MRDAYEVLHIKSFITLHSIFFNLNPIKLLPEYV